MTPSEWRAKWSIITAFCAFVRIYKCSMHRKMLVDVIQKDIFSTALPSTFDPIAKICRYPIRSLGGRS